MSRLDITSYSQEDSASGFRNWLGTKLLHISLRILPFEEYKHFKWRPNGFDAENHETEECYLAISSERINSQTAHHFKEGNHIYYVKHPEDGVLGRFLFWKNARKAAQLLSQEYEDYHFREYVHDQDNEVTTIAEEVLDDLEPNLFIEKKWVQGEINRDEWSESSTIISSGSVRTLSEVEGQMETTNESR